MNCEHAQETILDSLDGPITAERRLLLENHMATCEDCRRFAELQRPIDARMTACVQVPSLSAGFRASLQQKLSDERVPTWSESLPDIAHLAGCALGVVLLLLLLPQYSRTVLLAGSGFTVVTYFVQAVVRSSVERLEPNL